MGKQLIPSATEVEAQLKKKHFAPVYFFYGDDTYQIEQIVHQVEETAGKDVDIDFDKRVYFAKASAEDILSDVQSYPLAGRKKLVTLKEFEQRTDKEKNRFSAIFKNPPDYTIFIVTHAGKISAFSQEYLKVLTEQKYIYECKTLRSDSLEEWLVQFMAQKGKVITHDDARYLIMMCGEERSVLEMQIEKIILYMGAEERVTTAILQSQAVNTKKYQIFDIDKAIETGNKAQALKVAFALLNQGEYPLVLIGYLNKYFTTMARLPEIIEKQVPTVEAARILGVPQWNLPKLIPISRKFNSRRLRTISKALFDADIEVKSSMFDEQTIIAKLFSVIFQD
ncbi:MAG: DNA polymerase III subunit delta [Ignavibacteria bacterium]|nr:DNA polymerase III subunit delta [Ignavibacteria bacterium]